MPSFERGPAFDAIGAEHRAVRERVALIDMSSFSKFEVRGPGALALLQKLAGNDLDRPVGTIVYTQLCNERGGIEADVTITRLADDRFYFVTGSALGVRDRSTLERHLPADGSVAIVEQHVGEGRAEPLRPALARRAGAADRRAARQRELPVHERARARPRPSRRCSRCASPISASSATSCTCRSSTRFTSTSGCGRPARRFGIANVGYRAINSLRLEKHYLVWGSDITPDYNPYEAGLGFCVALGKGEFLARAALRTIKAKGPRQRLTWFTAPPEVNLFGGEIVLAGDRVLGRVTSAGYGYTVGPQHPAVRTSPRRAGTSRVRGRSDGRAASGDAPHAAALRSRPPRSSA